jgi:hypothetical protein
MAKAEERELCKRCQKAEERERESGAKDGKS